MDKNELFCRQDDFCSAIIVALIRSRNSVICNMVKNTRRIKYIFFKSQGYLSWVMMNITYVPDSNYVGQDSIRLFAQDKERAMSQLLTVNIDVYKPCLADDCLCKF